MPVDLAQFIVNVVLAAVTILLFIQGQSDRRRVAEDRRREQASKVSVLRHDLSEPTRPNAWNVKGTVIEVRNDSDAPITSVFVSGFGVPDWNAYKRARDEGINMRQDPRYKEEWIPFDDQPIPSMHIPPGETKRLERAPLLQNDLILRFTDGAGLSWVKTTRDGRLWSAIYARPKWWAAAYQRLHLNPITRAMFDLPLKYAQWKLRQVAPHIPLSARLARFLWGAITGPNGEPEPWLMPSGAPVKDWPYQEWIQWVIFERAFVSQKESSEESPETDGI